MELLWVNGDLALYRVWARLESVLCSSVVGIGAQVAISRWFVLFMLLPLLSGARRELISATGWVLAWNATLDPCVCVYVCVCDKL